MDKEKNEDISDYFSKESLHSKPKEEEENDEDSEEWFIDDKPPGDDVREIFVKLGSESEIEDGDLVSGAS